MRTGTPIGKNYVTLCIERIFAEEPTLREQLIEELADVLMYYNDVLLCYGITADELKQSYTNKFRRNMTRW